MTKSGQGVEVREFYSVIKISDYIREDVKIKKNPEKIIVRRKS